MRLIEKLRRSKSTGKTFILARWPEIQEALAAGFTKRAIYDELVQQGLKLSYGRFAAHIQTLWADEQDKAPAQKRKLTPPASNAKNEAPKPKRFAYDPKPNKDELV